MAFGKILVALNPSGNAQEIFDQAVDLALHEKSLLHLVSYLQWTSSLRSETVNDFSSVPHFDVASLDIATLQIELKRLQEMLSRYQAEAKQQGIEASLSCDIGDPGAMICAKAEDWGADLVLLGRRGRSGLSELLMGSISNYVLHHAPCSVLVIQGDIPPVA